jgi:methylmalonyl-CoA mutase N-terminal domain/subunit
VEAAVRAGLTVDAFASQLSFFFNAHNTFFEEIAKFRAARRLWARIMRERFRARDPRSWMLRFHTQTSGVTLTAQQPENNAVRVALQALAAVLGGTQSLHTNARDEALGLPTEAAALLALRTQQVLAHESGVADVVDPLGGSYFVEALTDAIEAEAAAYLEKIDAMGGMLRAVEVGYVQKEIQEAAYRQQRAVETGEQVVVGLNAYTQEEPVKIPVFRVDPAVEEEARRRLAVLRARRDGAAVERALGHLDRAARGSENLVPRILECVKSNVTVGEICHRLRAIFGEYEESITV